MNIDTRLAKLEGINKARLEKVQSAKAFAMKHFGTDSLTALQSLQNKLKEKENALADTNASAQQHLAHCLGKLENNYPLTPEEVRVAENFIAEQNRLKEDISALISDASSLGQDVTESDVDSSTDMHCSHEATVQTPTSVQRSVGDCQYDEFNEDEAIKI